MFLYRVEEGGGNGCEEIEGTGLRQDVVITSNSHAISLNSFRIFSMNYILLSKFSAFSDQCKEE